MKRLNVRRACAAASVLAALSAPGCGAGSENDAAFLKEAGVGTPIPDYDKGYAERKEKRQAEVDAAESSKARTRARGRR